MVFRQYILKFLKKNKGCAFDEAYKLSKVYDENGYR